MAQRKTFRELIAANRRNSVLLMFIMAAFLSFLGALFGRYYGSPAGGIVIALAVAALLLLISWYGGSGAVMAVNGASEIEKTDAPQLFNVVEEIAIAAGIPMPRVYLIDCDAPNAFATGIDPKHAAVAITTGLLNKLNRDELQGVMAHEIGHIRNFDIRYMMLMAVMVGSIVLLSDLFWRVAFISGGRRNNNRDNGNAQIVIMVLALVLAILAPFFATLIQLAMSRQREYLADATAVEFTRNPAGLCSALRKLANDATPMTASKATNHLYIVNPKLNLRGGSNSIFSTHPPIEERIKRLSALYQSAVQ